MRTNAIIFDLDGTLIDSFQDIFLALRGSAVALGLAVPSEKDIRGRMHLRLDDLVKTTFPEADVNAVVRKFRDIYDSSGYPHTCLYPDVMRTIEALRSTKHQMFVATNKRKKATEAIMNRLGLEGAFELVVSSDISDPPLSKSELVRLVMNEGGLQASRTVMVGDAIGDWNAATENGLPFILAEYGYGNIPHGEVHDGNVWAISSFKELIEVLRIEGH